MRAGRSGRSGFARRLFEQRGVPIAAAVILIVALAALFAPVLAPHSPNATNALNAKQPPSSEHLMGTDQIGRDVLSRLIYGSRVSIEVGFIAVGVGMAIGVPLGLWAGYAGGLIDAGLMRLVDAIIAFPSIILAMAIVGALGPGVVQIMLAIGISSMPVYSRLTRGQVLSVREYDFVLAGRAMGAGTTRLVLRHILPNSFSPLIVQGSLGVAFAILAEAGLSFLGVGVRPPTATWGGMLSEALILIRDSPYLAIFPGLAIFVTVLAINIIGDALRDVLDPRLRGAR